MLGNFGNVFNMNVAVGQLSTSAMYRRIDKFVFLKIYKQHLAVITK